MKRFFSTCFFSGIDKNAGAKRMRYLQLKLALLALLGCLIALNVMPPVEAQSQCGDFTAFCPTPKANPCANPTITCTGGACTGTDGPDVIQGTSGADNIDGRGGNDVICGGSGLDIITGGAGDDEIYGDAGADEITGDGLTTCPSTLGNDTIFGGDGADTIAGGAGADTLDGDAGVDGGNGGVDADPDVCIDIEIPVACV